MKLKLHTELVIINYSETSRLCWLKGIIERGETQPIPQACRNVRETAARIARKAYRLHLVRTIVPQITKSTGVRFESQSGDFYEYSVGQHHVKVFDVSDTFPKNFAVVTLSNGSPHTSVVQFRTERIH